MNKSQQQELGGREAVSASLLVSAVELWHSSLITLVGLNRSDLLSTHSCLSRLLHGARVGLVND